jgi:hypothetical protein
MQNPLILTEPARSSLRFAAFHALRPKTGRESACKQCRHRQRGDCFSDYQMMPPE